MRRLLFLALAALCLTGAAAPIAPRAAVRDASTAVSAHAAGMEDLFALSDLGGLVRQYLALSPAGDAVALFERHIDLDRNLYNHRLVVVDLATGHHRVVAEAGDIILASLHGRRSGAPLDRQPIWSRDGASIYYLAEHQGRVEIWRARADGGAAGSVVSAPGDVRRFRLSPDGDALIYETATSRAELDAQRARDDSAGFRVDENFTPLNGVRPLPDEDAGAEYSWRALAPGQTRPASAGERALLETPARGEAFVRALDPNARVDRPALGLFYAQRGAELPCPASACTGALKDAWVGGSAHRRLVVFRRLEGQAGVLTALYAWRPGAANARLVRRAEERLEGCVAASTALICLQDFPTQPRRLVRIDLNSGALRVLYDPNPQWKNVALPRIERLDYTDAEGNQSFAHVVYPLHDQRAHATPLVIVQYRSRGFLNAGTGGETPIFPLSAAGFLVLSVDRPEFEQRGARLSTDQLLRESELDDSEHAAKRDAILAFIAQLDARGLVDRRRLGITGMSDGAETVFDMLDTPIFSAAIASTPPTDALAYDLQSRHFHADRLARMGLTAPSDQSSPFFNWWRKNSPALRPAPIATPLMLNLSESEMVMAFPLLTRLETLPTPVESYIYPGAYHIKWRPSQIWAAQERTMAWLDFWLRGIERGDPARIERWRALRARALQAAASPEAGSPPLSPASNSLP